jgi:nuclear transport factor 2 (NTF2) superfamily protein
MGNDFWNHKEKGKGEREYKIIKDSPIKNTRKFFIIYQPTKI